MSRLLVPLILISATSALADPFDLQELSSARAMGMGGAYRSNGLGADSLYGNPAAMALSKTYQTELTGGYNIPSKDGTAATALRDSASGALAAGVGYNFLARGGVDARDYGHLTTLAVALPIADFLMLGVNGKYLYQTGIHAINAATMDAGVLIRPFSSFVFGVGAHNIIDTRHTELSRYYSASVSFGVAGFNIAADLRTSLIRPNAAPNLNAGIEYCIAELFFLRAGYQHDFLATTNLISAGVGFTWQGGGVDAAYRHEFGGEKVDTIALTLRISM